MAQVAKKPATRRKGGEGELGGQPRQQHPPTPQPQKSGAAAGGGDGEVDSVLAVVARRIRAAKKKLGKVTVIEEAVAAGKEVNEDQRKCLDTKAGLIAILDELGKLEPLLREAVAVEIETAAKAARLEAQAEAAEAARTESSGEKGDGDKEVADAEEEEAAPSTPPIASSTQTDGGATDEDVCKLIELLYFTNVFGGTGGGDGLHGREVGALLAESDSQGQTLSIEALQKVVQFGQLLMTKALVEAKSHDDALDRCKSLAICWLKPSPEGSSEVPAQEIRDVIDQIKTTEFFVAEPKPSAEIPEVSAPVEGSDTLHTLDVNLAGGTMQTVLGTPADTIAPIGSVQEPGLSEGVVVSNPVPGEQTVSIQNPKAGSSIDPSYTSTMPGLPSNSSDARTVAARQNPGSFLPFNAIGDGPVPSPAVVAPSGQRKLPGQAGQAVDVVQLHQYASHGVPGPTYQTPTELHAGYVSQQMQMAPPAQVVSEEMNSKAAVKSTPASANLDVTVAPDAVPGAVIENAPVQPPPVAPQDSPANGLLGEIGQGEVQQNVVGLDQRKRQPRSSRTTEAQRPRGSGTATGGHGRGFHGGRGRGRPAQYNRSHGGSGHPGNGMNGGYEGRGGGYSGGGFGGSGFRGRGRGGRGRAPRGNRGFDSQDGVGVQDGSGRPDTLGKPDGAGYQPASVS